MHLLKSEWRNPVNKEVWKEMPATVIVWQVFYAQFLLPLLRTPCILTNLNSSSPFILGACHARTKMTAIFNLELIVPRDMAQ